VGTGEAGFSGDGGPAIAAKLDDPEAIAFDAAGNLYIDDDNTNRIRRVDKEGTITTVAGTGESGFSGDGGPATAAELNEVEAISFHENGDLLIADTSNNRDRRVDREGIITTIAGTGKTGHSGDGCPATAATFHDPVSVVAEADGSLYISDHHNDRVRQSTPMARSHRSPEPVYAASQATEVERPRPSSTSPGRWRSAMARST
jgi:sugar lactone lactonase YvrE